MVTFQYRFSATNAETVRDWQEAPALDHQKLALTLGRLAAASNPKEVARLAGEGARQMAGADGAAFIEACKRDFDLEYQYTENGRFSNGENFSATDCVVNWSLQHGRTAVIEDVATDHRLPLECRPRTLARSLVVLPIGGSAPCAALAVYWAQPHRPTPEAVDALEALAETLTTVSQRQRRETTLKRSEARLDAMFARAPVGLCELSLKGEFVRVNDALCTILGRSREVLLQSSVPDVTHEDDVPRSVQTLQHLIETGEPGDLDKSYVRPDGALVWARSSLILLEDEHRQPSAIFVVTVDMTERTLAAARLKASEERYRSLTDLSPDGILVWVDGSFRYVNQAAVHLLGATSTNEIEQRSFFDFITLQNQTLAHEHINRLLEGQRNHAILEQRWRRIDGTPIDVEVSLGTTEWEERQAIQVVLRDISQRKEAEQRVWYHANFDALTKLPNRRLFRDRLQQEVKKARRAERKLALLFIDLDGFKQVNDLVGHEAGDQLLAQTARRLESCVRESDTVARPGGDEFTVILGDLTETAPVEQIAQKIIEQLSAPYTLGRDVVHVSGSVGITIYPNDASSTSELIRKADQAMYAAKGTGKNQFSYFTAAMDERAYERLRLTNDLREAVRNQQLELHYQPMVTLSNGRIDKAEAMLRWKHPQRGWVPPAEFIPLAEESGLINQIGDWVFQQAAENAKKWSVELGRDFQVSVNTSPIQFISEGDKDAWPRLLKRLDVAGRCLTVEITEGVLLQASRRVFDRLMSFHGAGIQVAIDDFGTGYSSLAYLKKFDIDYLKIDRSFVRDMTEDPTNRTIVETIIVMAQRLGLKVIAEGIETEEQRRMLLDAGCDYGQGFLFSRAVSSDRFRAILQTVLPEASAR